MKSFAPVSVISALFLASSALAQRTTITLPWANGDTIVASLATDVDGDTITQTLATVTGTGLVTTTPLTTLPTTTTRRLATTTATTATTAADDGDDPVTTTDADGRPLTTTGPRVVGQQETMAPMKTTTYWYDPGNGVWTVATWTASVTAEPTEATFIPAQGTIANYDKYQSEVNKNVFASAQAAADKGGSAAVSTGAAGRRAGAGVAVWSGAVLGAIGAGAAMVL